MTCSIVAVCRAVLDNVIDTKLYEREEKIRYIMQVRWLAMWCMQLAIR